MAGPFTDEQRDVLKGIDEDEKIAAWLNRRREAPGSRLLGFLTSPETLRTVLTSILIPTVAWLFAVAYTATWGHAAAQAAQDREDVEELAKLLPFLVQDGEGGKVSRVILQRRAEERGPHSILNTAMTTLLAYAVAQAPSQTPTAPDAGPGPQQTPVTPTAAKADATLSNPFNAPALVYIQMYGQADKDAAATISKAFQGQFVPVAGTEDVLRTHPGLNLRVAQRGAIAVRYYHAEDKAAADYAAALIAKTLNRPAATQDLSARGAAAQVKQGTVEVWFPYQG